MTEDQIYNRLKELEKIIDPAECNIIASHISGFLQDYEEGLNELNYEISNEWLRTRELGAKTDKMADRLMEVSDLWRKREHIKLRLIQLKRMRQDLKDRFQVLTSIRRY